MSYSPKRPGVIRAALCAVALLSALAAAPAMLSRTAAAQGAPPALGGPVWTDVPNPPKATASSASAALDCHGSTPPASYPTGPKPYPCGQVLVTGNFYADPIDLHFSNPCCAGSSNYSRVTGSDDKSYEVQITSLDDTASLYDPVAHDHSKWKPAANLIDTCKTPPGVTDPTKTVPWKDGNNKAKNPDLPIPCHSYRTATLLDPPGCHGGSPAVSAGYPCGKVLVQGPYDPFQSIARNGPFPSGSSDPSNLLKPDIDEYGGNGLYPDRPSGDSQLYDPTTDVWDPIPVPEGEHGHMDEGSKAILLANGGVLVVPGGWNNSSDPQPLFYVPTARDTNHPLGTWFQTPQIFGGHLVPSLALVSEGKRVLVNGFDANKVARTEPPLIYDPSSGASPLGYGSWSPTAPLPYQVLQATATTLKDGRVIVVGGNVQKELRPGPGFGFGLIPVPNLQPDQACDLYGAQRGICGSKSVLIFDPATNTWTRGPTLQNPRVYHSADLLPDGRVLVAGGYAGHFDDQGAQDGVSALDSVEIYDPDAPAGVNPWSAAPPLSHARGVHTSALAPFVGCAGKVEVTPAYLCARLMVVGGDVFAWTPVGSSPESDVYHATPEPTAEMLVPPPLITGLTPNRGPATRSTPVKVSGFALADSSLSFDGATAPPCAVSGCPAAGAPDTSALMMAPPRNTASEVSVPVKAATTLAGSPRESNSLPFTYFISPVVSGIDPVCGPEAGGTTVTLTGLQLTGADQVFFGDKPVSPQVLLDTKLTVQTPPHSAGEVQVTTAKFGDRSEGSLKFTYPCPVPPLIKTNTELNGGSPINPPAAPRPPVVQAAQPPGPAPASAPNAAVPGPGVHAIPQAPPAAHAAPQVQAQVQTQGLTQTQAQTAVHTQTQAAVHAQPVAALLIEPQAHIQLEGVRGHKGDSSWLASTSRAPAPVVALAILSGLMALLPLALKPKPSIGLPTARVIPRSQPAPKRAKHRRRR